MTESQPVTTRQDALEEHVILLAPSIGWWKGQYQLPRQTTDVTVDNISVAKNDVTTPRAKLINDRYPVDRLGTSWKKRFQRLDSRLERVKDMFSVKFPITGVRVVPKNKGAALMYELFGDTIGTLTHKAQRYRDADSILMAEQIETRIHDVRTRLGYDLPSSTPVRDPSRDQQSIAYELAEMADEFVADFDDILNQIRRESDVFEQVESKIPRSASAMRGKFFLDVVPIELAGNTGNSELSASDLAEHHEIVRDACSRQVESAVEEMIRGPRDQLAEALSNLRDLINRNGRVSEKSFTPIRRAIEKIRMFEFCTNEDLLHQMEDLERRLNITTPKSLDAVTAANSGFTAAIDGFMQEVTAAEGQQEDLEAFGKEFRAIDLDFGRAG